MILDWNRNFKRFFELQQREGESISAETTGLEIGKEELRIAFCTSEKNKRPRNSEIENF